MISAPGRHSSVMATNSKKTDTCGQLKKAMVDIAKNSGKSQQDSSSI
ncbi:hypothetical protein N9225_02805 [Akkermansiaceae bacterium]|nr:hypothetical protein [Akkermansiaceae bacterium]